MARVGSLLDFALTSRVLAAKRRIRVYLPGSYRAKPARRYPVLYLHDGQNVFSSAGKDAALGWGSWELDITVDELCAAEKMREVLMVAVDNTPERMDEYSGRRNPAGGARVETPFERYEAFFVRELKPLVDQEYRTIRDAGHTSVMGSSMGGTCSLELAWANPEVFGGAASLSGAFPVTGPDFGTRPKGEHGRPKAIRVYLDSGIADSGGGDDGCSRTDQVAAELKRMGWTPKDLMRYVDRRLLTRRELTTSGLPPEKWEEAQLSQHNEFYWRRRSWRALTFLFPAL